MGNRTRVAGHSLVELLVCVAIIGILMAMYLPALSKARRKAEEVAVREGFRQGYIGHMADRVNSVSDQSSNATREMCRTAFRSEQNLGNNPLIVTELKFTVRNEAEFRAYYFTLIDPAASGDLEFDNQGNLTAYDDSGNEYTLSPINDWSKLRMPQAVAWEFISTNLQETSSGTSGTNVLYNDGHVEYVPYPTRFPACRSVAELSHRFVAGG